MALFKKSRLLIYFLLIAIPFLIGFLVYKNRLARYEAILQAREQHRRASAKYKKRAAVQKKIAKTAAKKREIIKPKKSPKKGLLTKTDFGKKRAHKQEETAPLTEAPSLPRIPSAYESLQQDCQKLRDLVEKPPSLLSSQLMAPTKIEEPEEPIPQKLRSIINAHRGLPHMYRATPFWSEPRDSTPWLSTFDASIAGYSTRESRNAAEDTTELLNIFGSQDLVFLGFDVPNCNPGIGFCGGLKLLELGAIPQLGILSENFGKLKFKGKFKNLEAHFNLMQNFEHGFFTQLHIPIHSFEVKEINPPESLTPASEASLHNLQVVLDTLDFILAEFNLNKKDFRASGIGDVSLLAGWAYNAPHVNVSARIGYLVPTGQERDQNSAFALPLGYDGHFGGQISAEFAIKPWSWLAFGGYGHILFLGERTKPIRVKTHASQNGFIKLALADVRIEKGVLFNVGAHVNFNLFTRALGVSCGYSFTKKNKDKLTPLDVSTFSADIINTDPLYDTWMMQTLHFLVDCRFGNEASRINPHITAFFDLQLKGKRVFKAHSAGGTVGVDLSWYF